MLINLKNVFFCNSALIRHLPVEKSRFRTGYSKFVAEKTSLKTAGFPWPQVSREQVLARSPQAIVITGGPDQIPKIKQYWGEQLKIPVIPLTSDWFERASPRIILAAQQLCNALSQVD